MTDEQINQFLDDFRKLNPKLSDAMDYQAIKLILALLDLQRDIKFLGGWREDD